MISKSRSAVGSTEPMAPHNPGLLPIEPGTRLGPYEVQEYIGHGAMGVVYRAYHAQLERTGAVKVLQGIGPDPESFARFRREAQAIAHMRHPNILNVYDFGEHRGAPYMIVEFVPGGSLADRIQKGPVDPTTAIGFLRGIAEALDYAHSLGIVHRDVKPANVLIGPDDTPILADFGLAKLMQSSSIKSMTGMTTGTPAYMSPEQVTGTEVGPPADRYSLATIAYELLAGAYPFDGEGVLEMLYAHVHREAPPPSSVNPRLSPVVDAVILRGLAKAPDDRWQSCEAFVTALDAALKEGPAPIGANETIPLARPAPQPRPRVARAVPSAAATEVMAIGPPATTPLPAPVTPEPTVAIAPATASEKKPRRSRYLVGALLLIPLLLLAGYCGYGALVGTTLAISPSTLHAGDQLTVTADNVPPNQDGEIQLLSVLHRFPYRSDSHGSVTSKLTVPSDTPIGDHTVRICWNGSCHAQATLHVVGAVALVGPSANPSSSPSANPSPSPSSGPTAQPTSAPTAGPSPVPTQAPSPQPGPSPVPTPTPPPPPPPPPSPTPPPPPAPSISLSSNQIKMVGGTVTVYGQHFGAGKVVTITFVQGLINQPYMTSADSGGSFAKLINVPAGVLPGQATIKACDSSNACASQQITVTAL